MKAVNHELAFGAIIGKALEFPVVCIQREADPGPMALAVIRRTPTQPVRSIKGQRPRTAT